MGIDLSSGAPSAQFNNPGDTVAGEIVKVEQLQQTDMTTGEPQFWDPQTKLRPKMMISVTLHAPDHPDADEETGEVNVYLSGGKYSAVKAVTRRIDEGGKLWIRFVAFSDQAPAVKGHNRAKRYEAKYRAPAQGAAFDDEPAPAAPARAPRQQQSATVAATANASRGAARGRDFPDDEIPF